MPETHLNGPLATSPRVSPLSFWQPDHQAADLRCTANQRCSAHGALQALANFAAPKALATAVVRLYADVDSTEKLDCTTKFLTGAEAHYTLVFPTDLLFCGAQPRWTGAKRGLQAHTECAAIGVSWIYRRLSGPSGPHRTLATRGPGIEREQGAKPRPVISEGSEIHSLGAMKRRRLG